MGATDKNKKREEINPKFQWAIQDLYQNDDVWREEYNQVQELLTVIEGYQGHLSDSADTLLAFMKLNDTVSQLFERVYVYANQRYHENTKNSTYQKLSDMASSLSVELSSATAFATSELLSMDREQINRFVKEQPELEVYTRYFDILFRKQEHILSEAEEKILAAAGEVADAASNIYSMFNNADIKFGMVKNEEGNDVELTHARYSLFIQSKDRSVREAAFKAMYKPYQDFRNTLASTFSANVKQECFYAKARHYDSTLAMELDGANIPVSVYTNLIEAVHEKLPLLHKYISLRKKVLGVDEIHMYDLYTPLVSEVEMKIPYEEAKQLVADGLVPLGDRYQSILTEGYNDGWIDVYENEGKRSGAYSWGAYGTHPYVLLNYQDNLNNVFTLAHEMGHAIHSYMSDEAQEYIYAGYKIFVAEVASTCNEALLLRHLLSKTEDKKQRAYLINYHLEQFRTTLYRQCMFAEFEMMTHDMVEKNEPLTADALCEVYHELNVKYFGPEAVIDSEIDMEWARIPHFYNAFYVYQYATGFSAAIAISKKILSGEPGIVEQYFKFLSGGNSMDCIDLLKLCGVDMTSPKPVSEALDVFEEFLQEFEDLM